MSDKTALPINQQFDNGVALQQIEGMARNMADFMVYLQSDVVPDTPDNGKQDEGDAYEPSMHNEMPGGGKRFPGLDPRWMAIGLTDLQKGLMALRRAAGVGDGVL